MSIFEPCASIFDRFWKGFGSQNPPKINPKSIKNWFKNCSKNSCHFDSPLETNMMPKLPQHVPKPPHVAQFWTPKGGGQGVQRISFSLLFRLLVPSWGQHGSHTPPRWPQEPILAIFWRFLIKFYNFFIDFLIDFLLICHTFPGTVAGFAVGNWINKILKL